MATTKDDHVLTQLRTVLAVETAFNVVKVDTDKNKPTATQSVVYPWIIIDNYGSLALESGGYKGINTLDVGILVTYLVNSSNIDSTNLGNKQLKHADVKERLERRLSAWNASRPYSTTTTVGSVIVNLHGFTILSCSGCVDDKATEGSLMMIARLTYNEATE